MDIKISRNLQKEINVNKLKLRITKKRGRVWILFLCGLGVCMIIFNYLNENNFPLYMIGLLCICLGAGFMKFVNSIKEQARLSFQRLVTEYELSKDYTKIVLYEKYLFYKTPEIEVIKSWREFRKIIVKTDYIYMTMGGDFYSSYLIMKDEITENEFNQLSDFFNSNSYK